jgi:hypothetical protein
VVPADIDPCAPPAAAYRVCEYWHGLEHATASGSRAAAVDGSAPDSRTVLCDEAHPFSVPPTPRFPADTSYHVFAPVLFNGWAYLGEPGKIVAASARRVRSLGITGSGLEVAVAGRCGAQGGPSVLSL